MGNIDATIVKSFSGEVENPGVFSVYSYNLFIIKELDSL
jgi:hypothetical protein